MSPADIHVCVTGFYVVTYWYPCFSWFRIHLSISILQPWCYEQKPWLILALDRGKSTPNYLGSTQLLSGGRWCNGGWDFRIPWLYLRHSHRAPEQWRCKKVAHSVKAAIQVLPRKRTTQKKHRTLWFTNITMDKTTTFNGKAHCFNGHFNSYVRLPACKCNYGKSPSLMGTLTISIYFNCHFQ